MITTAIIAEFNPLHKGHEYIIREARKQTNADCIVIVMSGNFTQRGSIAIAPKHVRANAALLCGADLVIELPFAYATNSAELFALGAVCALNSLKSVDYLVFGSESGDITSLTDAARILATESEEFKSILNEKLSSGLTFPAARAEAFISIGGDKDIFTPNNILAIEYIKSIIQTNSSIKPVTIKRLGSGYNDISYVQSDETDNFISASAFRKLMQETKKLPDNVLPAPVASLLTSQFNSCFPIFDDDMMPLINYSLLANQYYLADYADFPKSVANRYINLKESGYNIFTDSFEELVLMLKTKDITASRISRALIHMLCGFSSVNQKRAIEIAKDNGALPYIRILGFSLKGQEYLGTIKKTIDACLINSLGKAKNDLDEDGQELIEFDIASSEIYAGIMYNKFGFRYTDEYRLMPILPSK